jgi:hypothetical protein
MKKRSPVTRHESHIYCCFIGFVFSFLVLRISRVPESQFKIFLFQPCAEREHKKIIQFTNRHSS